MKHLLLATALVLGTPLSGSAEPGEALPPVELLPDERGPDADGQARMYVRGFRVTGNRVLDDDELARALAPYTGRALYAEELIAARDAVTRLYVDRGYVTSGAFLPDQRARNGIVELQIEEGRLEEIQVEGTRGLASAYVRDRVALAVPGPVQVWELREALAQLQRDPRLRRIRAELVPGRARGRSALRVRVEEARPWSVSLIADNAQSPAIGSARGEIRLLHRNLTGRGDELELGWSSTRGLDAGLGRYRIPLGASDLALELHHRTSEAEVVEHPFDDLDIRSRASTWGARLLYPLLRDSGKEFWLGLGAEVRRSGTYLLDRRFAFGAGTDRGRTKLSVLRFSQDWTRQGLGDVMAARSTLSFGLDAFDATDLGKDRPDASFFSWLGQVQWVHRFESLWPGAQLLLRADAQLTSNPLFALEQFSVGGARSVRGYRENSLVRDNAVLASAELRIPILRSPQGHDWLQLAPFVDFGHAWNHKQVSGPKTLASVGLGIRYQPTPRMRVSLYWGQPLRHVKRVGNDGLQNHGIHIEATWLSF